MLEKVIINKLLPRESSEKLKKIRVVINFFEGKKEGKLTKKLKDYILKKKGKLLKSNPEL